VVSLQVDYRTCFNPEGLVAIVYDVQPRSGGIKVCCQHGVITHDGGKEDYWVPADKYVIKAPVGMFLPLLDNLILWAVLGSPTARCTNFRLMQIVQSRN
jgi:hypothetical protein